MARIGIAFIWLMAAGLVAQAAEPSRATVKKLAQELGDATLRGDYARVVDSTYPGVVKEMGGREKTLKSVEKLMNSATAQGLVLKTYKVGEPGEFLTEGGNTFVIVPTSSELATSNGKLVHKSYLLGISSDGGETWTFAGGVGLDKKEYRDKVLPKLPSKLKLPAKEKPEIIKGN